MTTARCSCSRWGSGRVSPFGRGEAAGHAERLGVVARCPALDAVHEEQPRKGEDRRQQGEVQHDSPALAHTWPPRVNKSSTHLRPDYAPDAPEGAEVEQRPANNYVGGSPASSSRTPSSGDTYPGGGGGSGVTGGNTVPSGWRLVVTLGAGLGVVRSCRVSDSAQVYSGVIWANQAGSPWGRT